MRTKEDDLRDLGVPKELADACRVPFDDLGEPLKSGFPPDTGETARRNYKVAEARQRQARARADPGLIQ